MQPEDRREVYKQDWDNVRYQDNLRWSRFKTIAAIEGAYLFAVYGTSLTDVKLEDKIGVKAKLYTLHKWLIMVCLSYGTAVAD
jgi:MFS-type transporter involved in bile tolerance (Atg22 family)